MSTGGVRIRAVLLVLLLAFGCTLRLKDDLIKPVVRVAGVTIPLSKITVKDMVEAGFRPTTPQMEHLIQEGILLSLSYDSQGVDLEKDGIVLTVTAVNTGRGGGMGRRIGGCPVYRVEWLVDDSENDAVELYGKHFYRGMTLEQARRELRGWTETPLEDSYRFQKGTRTYWVRFHEDGTLSSVRIGAEIKVYR